MDGLRKVDHSALRTNQVLIIFLLALAFVLDTPIIVAFVAAVMVIGAIFPQLRLFVRVYKHILKPAGLIKPDVVNDNPEPHRFSMSLGGVFHHALRTGTRCRNQRHRLGIEFHCDCPGQPEPVRRVLCRMFYVLSVQSPRCSRL